MAPFPVADTTRRDLIAGYSANGGPFEILAGDNTSFTVVDTSDYEAAEPPLSTSEKEELRRGYTEAVSGQVVSMDTMLSELEAKYGL